MRKSDIKIKRFTIGGFGLRRILKQAARLSGSIPSKFFIFLFL